MTILVIQLTRGVCPTSLEARDLTILRSINKWNKYTISHLVHVPELDRTTNNMMLYRNQNIEWCAIFPDMEYLFWDDYVQ